VRIFGQTGSFERRSRFFSLTRRGEGNGNRLGNRGGCRCHRSWTDGSRAVQGSRRSWEEPVEVRQGGKGRQSGGSRAQTCV